MIVIGTKVRINKPHLALNSVMSDGGHGRTGFVKSINKRGDYFTIGFLGVNEMCMASEDQLIIL